MSTERKGLMSGIADKVIFFAEVSPAMKNYKDNLARELEYKGCVIKEAKIDDKDIENIREIIDQCDAAIHILSDQDFEVSVSGKGLEEAQINYSVQHYLSNKLISSSSSNGFQIYAWHPKSATESIFVEENLSGHIKKIQHLEEVEFLRTNFEDFKYYLLEKIEGSSVEEVDEFYIKGNDSLCIYFLYDALDKHNAEEYVENLNNRGFTVFSPLFEGDILSIRQMHSSYLKKFDIAIIYGKEVSTNWISMKIMDILKSPGLGREKSIIGKAVFTHEQNRKSLPMINRGFEMISIDTGDIKNQLDEFLQNIRR